ncbi:MAG: TAXI family TRAP transporter solute-binding subunit, partial [Alphaproteobacteria bacterium]
MLGTRPLAIAATMIALAAAPAKSQQLGIGTMGQGTAGYSMGAAIAKVLLEKAKLQSIVQPAGGTSAYVPMIDGGEIDLGVLNIIEAKEALTGTGSFQGRKQANIRIVAVLYPFRSGFFVKKDAPAKTVADLKGLRIPYGYTAQVTLKSVTDAFLANANLTAADVKTVLVPNVIRGTDDFIAEKTDAGFFALGAGKVAEANASVSGGIRFLQMDDSPAAVARMQKVLP